MPGRITVAGGLYVSTASLMATHKAEYIYFEEATFDTKIIPKNA